MSPIGSALEVGPWLGCGHRLRVVACGLNEAAYSSLDDGGVSLLEFEWMDLAGAVHCRSAEELPGGISAPGGGWSGPLKLRSVDEGRGRFLAWMERGGVGFGALRLLGEYLRTAMMGIRRH